MNLPAEIIEKASEYLSKRFAAPCSILGTGGISGGCIHHAHKLDTNQGTFFLKWNEAGQSDNFLAEYRGLELLAGHSTDFTAVPLTSSSDRAYSFLLLEFIEEARPAHGFWQNFGQNLAGLHRNSASHFGLDHDNYIGRLPQSNRQHPDFPTFFIEERLLPQVQMARDANLLNHDIAQAFEELYPRLPNLLSPEKPALLHGDLWHGNFLCNKNNSAVLIDPAVYYGHREAELAFTHLFGGFGAAFYTAYDAVFPLESGWQERRDLFNLYPLLVHVNLFGSSYLKGVVDILNKFY